VDVSAPYRAVSNALDLDALVVLARVRTPLSAHAVSKRAPRGSGKGIALALKRLARQGLIDATPTGSATLYTLNEEHVAAPAVQLLANLRQELLDRIRTAIDEWAIPPHHASLFGSAARRDGDETSDIDLLIVRPGDVEEEAVEWREQLHTLTNLIERWSGNTIGLAEIGQDDIARLRHERPAIVDELEHDAIDLGGTSVRRLLGQVSQR
jgi:predicted nucleotidyltransferase